MASGSRRVVIFAGPSLNGARPEDVESRPSARRGDLAALTRRGECVVVLIDGAFFQVGSVTHREILDTLRSGLPVIGAASMGALRASELQAHGMVGIGTVYGAVRRGLIIDDSELAVAMASDGHAALTVPLVTIRCYLAVAMQHGFPEETLRAAWSDAHAVYFLDRNEAALLHRWRASGLTALAAHYQSLHRACYDVKQRDAAEAIRYAAALARGEPPPDAVTVLPLIDYPVPPRSLAR